MITNRESITVSTDGIAYTPLIILGAKQALLRCKDAIKEYEHYVVTDIAIAESTTWKLVGTQHTERCKTQLTQNCKLAR